MKKWAVLFFIFTVFLTCSGFSPFHKKTQEEQKAEFYENMWKENLDSNVKTQQDMEEKILEMALGLQNKRNLTKKERAIIKYAYRPMPVTMAEYKKISEDVKRRDKKIIEAKIPPDAKLEPLPEPRYVLKRYNKPPGSQNIDLSLLKQERQLNSQGVLSPAKDKLVYTAVYYEPASDKVSSEIYFIPTDPSKTEITAILTASAANKVPLALIQSGMDIEYRTLFRALTLVDWSADGNKIAVKERIGSSSDGIWQTNLWVFDFTTRTAKNLAALRDGIKYIVAQNLKFRLDDYRWDILPLGWDAQNPDRIYVCAYAYTSGAGKFLGLYTVDYKTEQAYFVSPVPMPVDISTNGLIIQKAQNSSN